MKNNALIIAILIVTLILSASNKAVMAIDGLPTNDTIPESMKKVSDEPIEEDDEFSSMERELEELDGASKRGDTTKIRIGKMKIEVVEDGDDITINKDNDWEDEDWDDDWSWHDNDDWSFHRKRNNDRFKPHWASFSMGLNNYVTSEGSTSLPDEWQLLEVNTNNSFEVNINFAQVGLNIVKQRVGLVTGVGMKWNNYKFRNNNVVLRSDSTALIVSENPDVSGKMSKLTTWYLMVPLLIEFQIPAGDKDLYLNAGVEGGLKLSAHTKIKSTNKQKFKDKRDFFTTSLDYRVAARVGYGEFGIYAAYSMMPLFEKDKGPELYPLAVGVSLNF